MPSNALRSGLAGLLTLVLATCATDPSAPDLCSEAIAQVDSMSGVAVGVAPGAVDVVVRSNGMRLHSPPP